MGTVQNIGHKTKQSIKERVIGKKSAMLAIRQLGCTKPQISRSDCERQSLLGQGLFPGGAAFLKKAPVARHRAETPFFSTCSGVLVAGNSNYGGTKIVVSIFRPAEE